MRSFSFLMKKVKTGHTSARALTLDDFTFGQIFGIQKWMLMFIYTIFMCVLMQSFCLPAPSQLPFAHTRFAHCE